MTAVPEPESEAALTATIERVAGVELAGLQRLTGGAGRQTWRADVASDGTGLVVQVSRDGGGHVLDPVQQAEVIIAAAAAGVACPPVVAAELGTEAGDVLVTERVEGETIPRRLLRDDAYSKARDHLVDDMATALARLHRVDPAATPSLEAFDPLTTWRDRLDAMGRTRPTFEYAFRWLAARRPAPSGHAVVHGDFRLGNLIVGSEGLAAVIDWELAHLGDPLEDLGWLCVRAWRFGADQPVAGLGGYHELITAYEAAGGAPVDGEALRWWEVLGTLKWGIICMTQAETHLSGTERSVELAVIGRRVTEVEHDLVRLWT